MNQRKQSGKLTFTGILMLAILIFGIFVAVRFISAGVTETQITKEVEETLSAMRGPEFTEERAIDAAKAVIMKKEVIFDPDDESAVIITLNRNEGKIKIFLKYDILIDCILFKHTKHVESINEIMSYN